MAAPMPCASRAATSRLVGVGGAADERRECEQGEPGEEDAAAAEEVGGASAEEEEAAVGEHVAAHDPLQALLGEAELMLDRGQRDVDDRDVEEVEKLDEQKQRQCQHAPAASEKRRFRRPRRLDRGRVAHA